MLIHYQIFSVNLLETFCPHTSLSMKFGTGRSEGNNCIVLKTMSITFDYLNLLQIMTEQLMFHNCASLCSLCKGKEGVKKVNISLVFMNYRNKNQNVADCLFGSNRKVNVCLRRLRRWNSGSEQF